MSEENTLDGLSLAEAEDALTGPLPSSLSLPGRDGLLDRYLAEVSRHPVLDPETERILAERYVRTGDRDAADRLVTANLRLVIKMAAQYRWKWARMSDLIQEGNVGLMIALSHFDPTRGVPFGRYAIYWIRAMILRYLSANYRLVDMGSGQYARKLFFRLNQERARLRDAGIAPTTRLLAEAFGVPETAVHDIDRFLRAPAISLHAPADGDDGAPLELMLGDSRTADPEQIVAEMEWRALVRTELERFSETLEDEREQYIWQQRLAAPSPLSLTELGQKFGVSKQRVAQVEGRIKRRLKATLSEGIGGESESILCDPLGWSSHVRCTRNFEHS